MHNHSCWHTKSRKEPKVICCNYLQMATKQFKSYYKIQPNLSSVPKNACNPRIDWNLTGMNITKHSMKQKQPIQDKKNEYKRLWHSSVQEVACFLHVCFQFCRLVIGSSFECIRLGYHQFHRLYFWNLLSFIAKSVSFLTQIFNGGLKQNSLCVKRMNIINSSLWILFSFLSCCFLPTFCKLMTISLTRAFQTFDQVSVNGKAIRLKAADTHMIED